jgi:hypothetical protein
MWWEHFLRVTTPRKLTAARQEKCGGNTSFVLPRHEHWLQHDKRKLQDASPLLITTPGPFFCYYERFKTWAPLLSNRVWLLAHRGNPPLRFFISVTSFLIYTRAVSARFAKTNTMLDEHFEWMWGGGGCWERCLLNETQRGFSIPLGIWGGEDEFFIAPAVSVCSVMGVIPSGSVYRQGSGAASMRFDLWVMALHVACKVGCLHATCSN